MRILLASSEVYPYAKTGGLADMVAALGKTLARAGHRVGVVTPLHRGIRARFPGLERIPLELDLPLGERRVQATLWALNPAPGLTVYFVDQPALYDRADLYGEQNVDYPDNAARYTFFAKAVAYLAQRLAWQPELLHLHDWQAALAAPLLRHEQKAGQGTAPGICLTIHNLAYQGLFPGAEFGLTNLPPAYFTQGTLEFYGKMNCLKAGIVFADVITTVSPRYAREITTEELGCGLDGLLRQRNSALVGILNGVDYEEWDAGRDPFLEQPFSSRDLSGKMANKLALQKEFGLPVDGGIPLFGNIGRLAEQKGVDILFPALAEMLRERLQFVLIGSGARVFEAAARDLARRFPNQASVRIEFDEGISHRIEAGSDFFLMPSRFEPCGLNQMYGLRYATIPIVRTTGGLDDSVIDVREDAENANGIKFVDYSPQALAKGIQKALALFQAPEALHRFRLNAMAADFSWERTVADYVTLYERAATRSSDRGR